MDERLVDHIERTAEICRGRLSMAARGRRVEASARETLAGAVELPGYCFEPPAEGYGRHLLYRCPEQGFVVIALTWPGGIGTPIHDHGTWGVVAVHTGRVETVDYLRQDDGTNECHANLLELRHREFAPGQVVASMPPHDDVHLIRNAVPDAVSVTIHTYGADLKACRVFNVETGRVDVKQLRYHTEYARA